MANAPGFRPPVIIPAKSFDNGVGSTGLGTEQKSYTEPKNIGETHKLAFGDMSNTFTGSDIKCLIIRRDDQLLLKRAMDYLTAIQNQAAAKVNPRPKPELEGAPSTEPNFTPQNPEDEFSSRNFVLSSEMSDYQVNATDQALYEANQAIINGQGILDASNGVSEYNPNTTIPLVNLQAITVSTFRAKRQVRALGHTGSRGVVRGTRTCGGTIILTEFNKDVFWDLVSLKNAVPGNDFNIGDEGNAVLPDQVAPFDILLLFSNEAGHVAYRMIYEVEIVTNGIVYSIQDMYNESTLSFLCTDVSPLIPLPAIIAQDGTLDTPTFKSQALTIKPLQQVRSGSEIARRFRLLKNSRITNS